MESTGIGSARAGLDRAACATGAGRSDTRGAARARNHSRGDFPLRLARRLLCSNSPARAGWRLSCDSDSTRFALSGPVNQPSNEAKWLEGTRVVSSPISAQLDSFEQSSLANRDLNPAITASLHQNLAIVDNYISLCEKSVQEEPENEVARDYLYSAYKQKADLLAQIGERGENVQ